MNLLTDNLFWEMMLPKPQSNCLFDNDIIFFQNKLYKLNWIVGSQIDFIFAPIRTYNVVNGSKV